MRSISWFTALIRSGSSLIVCAPSSVRLLSRMNVAIGPLLRASVQSLGPHINHTADTGGCLALRHRWNAWLPGAPSRMERSVLAATNTEQVIFDDLLAGISAFDSRRPPVEATAGRGNRWPRRSLAGVTPAAVPYSGSARTTRSEAAMIHR